MMKSIMEQASSIMKAIEKAWNQAEQPKEFSIKIFEKEERNFFGMTTKPAKIGIFFGDKPIIHEKPVQKPRPEIKECRPAAIKPTTEKPTEKLENKSAPKPEEHHKPSPQQQAAPKSAKPIEQQATRSTTPAKPTQPVRSFDKAQDRLRLEESRPVVEKKPVATPKEEKAPRAPAAWNETMVTSAHNWLKRTLDLMNMGRHQFNSEIAGKNLKLTFHAPLITDVAHEKQLFRSFAHLIMSSLRNQYKQEIRDLKVILIRPE